MSGAFRGISSVLSLFADDPNFETQYINRCGFAKGLNFAMGLHLYIHTLHVYANSEGPGESVHLEQLLNNAITSNISSAGPIIPFNVSFTGS